VASKKLRARRAERQHNRIISKARSLVGNFAYVLLAGAVVLFAVVIVAAAHSVPVTNTLTGGAGNVNAAGDDGSEWIPLTSNAPGAIIAAARKSSLFKMDRSGNGDYLKDISHLETPVLVHAMHAAGSISMPDYYVIPIDGPGGTIIGAAELALNPEHTAIQVTSIITYDAPRPHGKMAHLDQGAAQSALATQKHVNLRNGAQAQLVYAPIDATALETGEVTWSGGGLYPADPIWLIPGSDGKDHVVGTNGKAFDASSVPLMKQP
jgi:hypothetical protein